MKATAVTAASSRRFPGWAWTVATFFGIGCLRPAPGTWGSVAALAVWYGLSRIFPGAALPPLTFLLVLVALALGIPASTRVAAAWQERDPSRVVIDEVAGQLLTLLAAPPGWKTMFAGLILFRALDITKPFPLRQIEQLSGGTGIMLDDVGAGVYALLLLQLLLHWRVLS